MDIKFINNNRMSFEVIFFSNYKKKFLKLSYIQNYLSKRKNKK